MSIKAFSIGIVLGLAFCGVAELYGRTDTARIYSTLSQSVVRITNESESSGGTGFIVQTASGKRLTLTNWHVCGSESHKWAYRANEFSQVKLRVIASDPLFDLCVLEPAAGPAVVVSRNSPTPHNTLYVVGHPLLKEASATHGSVIGPVKVDLTMPFNTVCPDGFTLIFGFQGAGCAGSFDLIDTTVQVFPGSSGSPVINEYQELVGVINGVDGRTGWGMMVRLEDVKTFLETIK